MEPKETDAYKNGYNSRLEGFDDFEIYNPYDEEDSNWFLWNEGFFAATELLLDKDSEI